MAANWILLHAVPETGKHFILEDQNIWLDPIREFGLSCTVLDPMRAEFTVFLQEDGVFIRGKVTGRVAVPCTRCMEAAVVLVDQHVDSYELFPVEDGTDEDRLGVDEELLRPAQNGSGVEMNLAALAWEEFSLALPMKPLCDMACKGLCTQCGANRNTAPCACEMDTSDPRLALLRNLKVDR